MPEQLLPWLQPTAYGLLSLVILMILFGYLVPHRQLRRERERGDEYKAAWLAADERADKLADAYQELVKRIS